MPKIRTRGKKVPEGFELIEPALDEFQQRMREAENEPHEGKRKVESLWPIHRIHWERNRYIFKLYYKEHKISKELYDFLVREGYADHNLIAKWRKPGFEFLCSVMSIDPKNSKFATSSICRVPLHKRDPDGVMPAVTTGCVSCASCDSYDGQPIWWDTWDTLKKSGLSRKYLLK
eukprot:Filipodium_phascolosomae@DN614_c0_g1_i1.p1